MQKEKHQVFTERQLNCCEYGGAFGVLLATTCLVQHLIVTNYNWLAQLMTPTYVFAMLSFLLLALRKPVSIVLLFISALLSLTVQMIWLRNHSLSVVVLAHFFYHVILLVALFSEQVPPKLIEYARIRRAERDEWAGKI